MRLLIAIDPSLPVGSANAPRAVEGELVAPVSLGCADDSCASCHASWSGLVSHRPTRTAMIVDRLNITERDLRGHLHAWLDGDGVVDLVVQASEAGEYEVDGIRVDDPVAAVDELVGDHVAEIRTICAAYPVGTVVTRLGTLIAPERLDAAA